MKSLIAILLILTVNSLSAQYLHYEDRSNINRKTRPAKPATDSIIPVSEPVEPAVTLVSHVRNTIPPKAIVVAPIINSVTVSNLIVPLIDSEVVYHTWPDLCPGRPGSIPVLTNYVPHILVLKLTEIFKGHLYAITSIKVDDDTMNYQLKVCINGEIVYEQADEDGDIIP